MKVFNLLAIFLIVNLSVFSQHEETVNNIFKEALGSRIAYQQLDTLCHISPGRISGTLELNHAIEYTYAVLRSMQLDRVYKQQVTVPNWKRGVKEIAYISVNQNKIPLSVCALGNSLGTGSEGLQRKVIEITRFEDLKTIPVEKIKNTIVFLNEPMDPTHVNTFHSYGAAGTQRVYGASRAAEKGAAGVIIRSATPSLDDFPHTGVIRYNEDYPKIPAISVSTMGAEKLHQILKNTPEAELFFKTTSITQPDTTSWNVIGEIKGEKYPEKIITVGGHIDAWFNGEGAHDDGAGCIHAIEVLRIFKALNIQPKHTIRAVMFVDEEIAQRGGKAYARIASEQNEQHVLALESDRGGFSPRGFTIDADSTEIKKIQSLLPYFAPYGIHEIIPGYGGVDINALKSQGTTLVGFLPDWQRYFDYHHAASDVFEAVNIRELQMGSAAIASFIFLMDQIIL